LATALIVLVCAALAQRIVFTIAALATPRRRDIGGAFPAVQVLVASRNEEAALPGLFESLDRLDYPPDKLSFVLVSDGSTDATETLMTHWCSKHDRGRRMLTTAGVGKSSALQAALSASAGADLTAIYDSDVRPAPNALRMLTEEFCDPRVGAASGAVVPSNPDVNSVTRYSALELYVFHQVIQTARHRLRLSPPAVGAHCMYRTAALKEIGGFPTGAISEDVATSFELVARGWRTTFRRDAVVTTQVPTSLRQFWVQRQRWTRGLSRAAGRARRVSALLVATGYADRLVFLVACIAAATGRLSWWWPALYFAGPGLNIVVALHRSRAPHWVRLLVGSVPMFVVDVSATLVGMLSSARRVAPAWMPGRQRA
jgi:cellulose synthase/poly-beta-1,6-N-acetylglucosamine synthase-like glycosyltransferase